jgi:hypothetical protein
MRLKMAGNIFERRKNYLTVTMSSEGWCILGDKNHWGIRTRH